MKQSQVSYSPHDPGQFVHDELEYSDICEMLQQQEKGTAVHQHHLQVGTIA
jgi:hypothetical protein